MVDRKKLIIGLSIAGGFILVIIAIILGITLSKSSKSSSPSTPSSGGPRTSRPTIPPFQTPPPIFPPITNKICVNGNYIPISTDTTNLSILNSENCNSQGLGEILLMDELIDSGITINSGITDKLIGQIITTPNSNIKINKIETYTRIQISVANATCNFTMSIHKIDVNGNIGPSLTSKSIVQTSREAIRLFEMPCAILEPNTKYMMVMSVSSSVPFTQIIPISNDNPDFLNTSYTGCDISSTYINELDEEVGYISGYGLRKRDSPNYYNFRVTATYFSPLNLPTCISLTKPDNINLLDSETDIQPSDRRTTPNFFELYPEFVSVPKNWAVANTIITPPDEFIKITRISAYVYPDNYTGGGEIEIQIARYREYITDPDRGYIAVSQIVASVRSSLVNVFTNKVFEIPCTILKKNTKYLIILKNISSPGLLVLSLDNTLPSGASSIQYESQNENIFYPYKGTNPNPIHNRDNKTFFSKVIASKLDL